MNDVMASAGAGEQCAILEALAREAGALALRWFHPDGPTRAEIFYKSGNSPVTEADLAVDLFLKVACARAFPDCGWLSEETTDDEARLAARRLIVVDPIDGTKAFLAGDPRWCVSIALVEAGRPILGALHAPALDETFVAAAGRGAWLNGERLRLDAEAIASDAAHGPRPMVDWLGRLLGRPLQMQPRIPSLAYRIAVVARGDAAVGLAGPNSHDWDIAAADLVLVEAGGALVDIEGRPPVYNRPNPVHPALIGAEAGHARLIVEAIRRSR